MGLPGCCMFAVLLIVAVACEVDEKTRENPITHVRCTDYSFVTIGCYGPWTFLLPKGSRRELFVRSSRMTWRWNFDGI